MLIYQDVRSTFADLPRLKLTNDRTRLEPAVSTSELLNLRQEVPRWTLYQCY